MVGIRPIWEITILLSYEKVFQEKEGCEGIRYYVIFADNLPNGGKLA